MNKVTIRDVNIPLNIDEFSEEFVGYIVVSLLDFFSRYNQALLNMKSKDITAFQTLLSFVQTTRLL